MKIKVIFFLVGLAFLLGCKKKEKINVIEPVRIEFISQDGSKITENDCIDPAEPCSILIETRAAGDGKFEPTTIEYTVNGFLYSMTFTRDGIKKSNPISLISGTNEANILGCSLNCQVSFVLQGDFEVVE